MRSLLVFRGAGSSASLLPPLHDRGWSVEVVQTAADLAQQMASGRFLVGLALIDGLDDGSAELLSRLLQSDTMEWIAVIDRESLTRAPHGRTLVECCYDFHTAPVDVERLLVTLGHAYGKAEMMHQLRYREEGELGRFGMIGRSAKMLALYRALEKIVRVDAPVLISGESGTGKEIAARAVHEHSTRRQGPFITVNCGALPTSLVQSELFGHERGAFTGAHQQRIGSIEAANGGTVFLDEIGDLPLESQASLLRFLQEKTIVRVGATRQIKIDARVVAATHVDLAAAVSAGRFREDLFFRLNVLHLHLPPLRERDGDKRLIAEAVFRSSRAQRSAGVRGISKEALDAIDAYSWRGNVRELMNRLQRAMVMCEGRFIGPRDLGLSPRDDTPPATPKLREARKLTERDVVAGALLSNRFNLAAAARHLGVSRVTLYRLMERLDIKRGSVARPMEWSDASLRDHDS